MKVPRIVSRGYQCSHQNISIQVILMANVEKYKTMACQPGAILTEILEEAFSLRIKGEGPLNGINCGVAYYSHTAGRS